MVDPHRELIPSELRLGERGRRRGGRRTVGQPSAAPAAAHAVRSPKAEAEKLVGEALSNVSGRLFVPQAKDLLDAFVLKDGQALDSELGRQIVDQVLQVGSSAAIGVGARQQGRTVRRVWPRGEVGARAAGSGGGGGRCSSAEAAALLRLSHGVMWPHAVASPGAWASPGSTASRAAEEEKRQTRKGIVPCGCLALSLTQSVCVPRLADPSSLFPCSGQ